MSGAFTYGTTARGFGIVTFIDRSDTPCSIQESSACIEDENGECAAQPGSSALWIGCDGAEPKIMKSRAAAHGLSPEPPIEGWMPYPIPDDVLLSTRAHLDRVQVKELVKVLQRWLRTGSLLP